MEAAFDVNNGVRELVDEARAKALVAEALAGRDPTALRRACLTNKSYSEEAAAVLAEALQEMTGLEEVDLSDMIAGRPEEVGLCVLRAVCGALSGRVLRSIDLSDNAMGEKGINACRAALEGQPALRSLKLCNDGLSASAMEAVSEIVLAQTPTLLETLHFHNNMSGDGGAQAVAKMLPHCPQLVDLRFSGTRAGAAGSVAVAEALAGSPAAAAGAFRSLDLADNTFGADGGQFLAEVLRNQRNLFTLNLRDAALGDEGAVSLLEALAETAPQLAFLDLSGNELTEEAMPALCRAIVSKPALRCLMLEENELGTAGAKLLAEGLAAMPGTAIEIVQLNTNEIGTSAAVAIVRALARKPSLASLELNGNCISEDGLKRLSRMLEAAGKPGALGEMDDNDADAAEEQEEEEDEEEEERIEEAADGGVAGEAPGMAAAAGEKEDEDGEVDELARELGEIKM